MLLNRHPCGTAMDLITRPYRVMMRTAIGRDPVEVLWFRAPVGAKVYEGPTPFRSMKYVDSDDKENVGLGEQIAFECCHFEGWTNYNGYIPAPYKGQDVDGPFAYDPDEGVGTLPPPFVTNEIGQPPGCESPVVETMGGGEVEGGGWIVGGPVISLDGGEVEGGAWAIPAAQRGSGGIRLGGAAAQAVHAIQSALGGISLGGAAAEVARAIQTTLGGIRLGGTDVQSASARQVAAGGLKLGGSAVQGRVYRQVAAGGLKLGGSAYQRDAVITACCTPVATPKKLLVTFQGAFAGVAAVQITWNGVLWTGTTNGSCGTTTVTFTCTGGGLWTLVVTGKTSPAPLAMTACSPVTWQGGVVNTVGACLGAYSAAVTKF